MQTMTPDQTTGKRILIVDDETDIRDLVAGIRTHHHLDFRLRGSATRPAIEDYRDAVGGDGFRR